MPIRAVVNLKTIDRIEQILSDPFEIKTSQVVFWKAIEDKPTKCRYKRLRKLSDDYKRRVSAVVASQVGRVEAII